MKPLYAIYPLLVFVMVACTNMQKPKQTLEEKQKEIELGKIDAGNSFEVDELGWKTTLPADWPVITKRDNQKLLDEGAKAMKKYYKTDIKIPEVVTLIRLKKDDGNMFIATMQEFDSTRGSYEQQAMEVQNAMINVYKADDMYAEQFLGAVRIDGVMFDRIELKIFASDKKTVAMKQKVFFALINRRVLMMSINFNNEEDEKELMNTVMQSRFSIKE